MFARSLFGTLALFATLVAMCAGAAVFASEPDLGGRPFSPPGEVMPMPPSWTAKRIARPADADVALAIDQQLYPALLPLIRRYSRETGLKVAITEGTCGVAAGALAEKSADITGMCCPPGPLDRMPGVRYHTIGIAALALIVHPTNRTGDVSLAEARRMFGGKVGRWSELPASGVISGPGEGVRAVARLHCKPRPGHWRLLIDDENLFAPDVTEVAAIIDMISEVARNPGAIGYETLWHVADKTAAGRVVTLRLSGVDPRDRTALAAGRYPLYRVFNITSWEGSDFNPHARRLTDWLVEHAGDIDPSFGIVPISDLKRNGWRFDGDEVVGQPD